MSRTIEGVKVTTTHEEFGAIEVVFDADVPADLDEASEWYGSQDKLIEAIQSDAKTRIMNAVRPVLAGATHELDWTSVAQNTANEYRPGKRGGPSISEDDVAEIDDAEALRELLRARGVLK